MELLGPVCVAGPLTASMIAAARCLAQPSFKVQTILRAVLRDEMIAGHKKVKFSFSCFIYLKSRISVAVPLIFLFLSFNLMLISILFIFSFRRRILGLET